MQFIFTSDIWEPTSATFSKFLTDILVKFWKPPWFFSCIQQKKHTVYSLLYLSILKYCHHRCNAPSNSAPRLRTGEQIFVKFVISEFTKTYQCIPTYVETEQ